MHKERKHHVTRQSDTIPPRPVGRRWHRIQRRRDSAGRANLPRAARFDHALDPREDGMSSATVIAFPKAKTPIPKPRKRDARKAARRRYRHSLLAEARERAKASSDPIFAAIVTHLEAMVAKCDHADYTSGSFEREQAEKLTSQRLWDFSDATLRTLLATAPSSLEGVIALLEHLARHEFLDPRKQARRRRVPWARDVFDYLQ
jgi:hypothetical protein